MTWIKATSSWWPSRGELPSTKLLSRQAARRADDLTRACAYVIDDIDAFTTSVPIVYGSCLGGVTVLFSLLDELDQQDFGLSPIGFSTSVHHAPASAVGVSNKHVGMLTAISANEDLAAMLMIEALDVAHEFDEVIVVAVEETWPQAFGVPPFELYAGALVLGKDSERNLMIEPTSESVETLAIETLTGNPAARVEHLIQWSVDARPGDEIVFAPHVNGGSWKARCQ